MSIDYHTPQTAPAAQGNPDDVVETSGLNKRTAWSFVPMALTEWTRSFYSILAIAALVDGPLVFAQALAPKLLGKYGWVAMSDALGMITAGAITLILTARIRDGKALPVSSAIWQSLLKFPRFALISYWVALQVGVGLICLVVPGLVLDARYLWCTEVVILEPMQSGDWTAARRCRVLAAGRLLFLLRLAWLDHVPKMASLAFTLWILRVLPHGNVGVLFGVEIGLVAVRSVIPIPALLAYLALAHTTPAQGYRKKNACSLAPSLHACK